MKILVVEDDIDISNMVAEYCSAYEHEAVQVMSGSDAVRVFQETSPDIVLLDIMLPGLDGLEVCRRIRSISSVPIIMVSSKKDDSDKVLSLTLGADDYVEKPFSMRVLMAKISALGRRSYELSAGSRAKADAESAGAAVAGTGASQNHHSTEGQKTYDPSKEEGAITVGGLVINPRTRLCHKNGTPVELSKVEFDILYYLMLNKNQALSRERIFDGVWGEDDYGDVSTVTVHIKKIRDKVEDDSANPTLIQTIRGVGYAVRD